MKDFNRTDKTLKRRILYISIAAVIALLAILLLYKNLSKEDTTSNIKKETTSSTVESSPIETTETSVTQKESISIEEDRFILESDSEIDIPENLIETIDSLIDRCEEETGLDFNNGDPNYKINIQLSSDINHAVKANTNLEGITIYTPYYQINEYGISVLTHELMHMLTLRNVRINSLIMLEGIAEVYGDKICRETSGFPMCYESYEYGTGVIRDQITPNNAEDLFDSELTGDKNVRAPYQYGTAFVTYLCETNGYNWFSDYVNNYLTVSSDENLDAKTFKEGLKEQFGESVFEEFAIWYQDNSERFRLDEPIEDQVVLSDLY